MPCFAIAIVLAVPYNKLLHIDYFLLLLTFAQSSDSNQRVPALAESPREVPRVDAVTGSHVRFCERTICTIMNKAVTNAPDYFPTGIYC